MSQEHSDAYSPICPMCHQPVRVEEAKTNEGGHATHEESSHSESEANPINHARTELKRRLRHVPLIEWILATEPQLPISRFRSK
jgi:hypothetical protein